MKRTREEYLKEAIARYGCDDIEFDNDAKVHEANGGVWVTAVVWVPDEDEDEEKSG